MFDNIRKRIMYRSVGYLNIFGTLTLQRLCDSKYANNITPWNMSYIDAKIMNRTDLSIALTLPDEKQVLAYSFLTRHSGDTTRAKFACEYLLACLSNGTFDSRDYGKRCNVDNSDSQVVYYETLTRVKWIRDQFLRDLPQISLTHSCTERLIFHMGKCPEFIDVLRKGHLQVTYEHLGYNLVKLLLMGEINSRLYDPIITFHYNNGELVKCQQLHQGLFEYWENQVITLMSINPVYGLLLYTLELPKNRSKYKQWKTFVTKSRVKEYKLCIRIFCAIRSKKPKKVSEIMNDVMTMNDHIAEVYRKICSRNR